MRRTAPDPRPRTGSRLRHHAAAAATSGEQPRTGRDEQRRGRSGPLDEHARDARSPSAAPPKIMLVLQANASVTVPAGAACPSSTELQALNGAIVRPKTNSASAERRSSPSPAAAARCPTASAVTSTGSWLRCGVAQVAARRRPARRRSSPADHTASRTPADEARRALLLDERRHRHLDGAEARADAGDGEQQRAHGRRRQRPEAAAVPLVVRPDGAARAASPTATARRHAGQGGRREHRRRRVERRRVSDATSSGPSTKHSSTTTDSSEYAVAQRRPAQQRRPTARA